jgi:hypothetical protein
MLTVLIPTRDRSQTLGSTIRSCIAQDYPHLTIVVSDNCSTDGTADLVAAIDDPRLHYVRTPRRLSMTGNFEFSLSQVKSGYLMHLGDDDGLMIGAASDVARIIQETGAEAVNSAHAVYHWPTSLYTRYRNRLIMPFGRGYRWVKGLDAAADVIAFRQGYPYLPSTYSGFVAKAVIDRVAAGASYYSSITPDSYAGFVNAGVMDKFVYSERPFAIAGLSGRSNGGSNVNSGDPNEAQRYLAENDLPTHPDIVYCPKSIPLVVAEAFLQARNRVPRLRDFPFDVRLLCRVALRDVASENYRVVRDAVIETADRHNLRLVVPRAPTLAQKLDREADRARVRIRRLREGYRRIAVDRHGVEDVAGASRLAHDLLGL